MYDIFLQCDKHNEEKKQGPQFIYYRLNRQAVNTVAKSMGLESDCLSLNPTFATHLWCDLAQ